MAGSVKKKRERDGGGEVEDGRRGERYEWNAVKWKRKGTGNGREKKGTRLWRV